MKNNHEDDYKYFKSINKENIFNQHFYVNLENEENGKLIFSFYFKYFFSFNPFIQMIEVCICHGILPNEKKDVNTKRKWDILFNHLFNIELSKKVTTISYINSKNRITVWIFLYVFEQ